jgi:replicative DNA helicase
MADAILSLLNDRWKQHFRQKDGSYDMIPTPFATVNEKIKGFKKGELILIAGRPGMGKTTLALQIAIESASVEKQLFVSLDNDKGWISDKVISQLESQSFGDIQSGKLREEIDVLSMMDSALIKASKRGFDTQFSLKSLRSIEKLLEIKHHDLLIIDWFQMLTCEIDDPSLDLIEVVKELKRIAKQKNIAIILTGNVSWMVEERGGDKRPVLSDIRCPEEAEEHFDKVFMLYRPEYYDITEDWEGNSMINKAELYLVKNLFQVCKRNCEKDIGLGYYLLDTLI